MVVSAGNTVSPFLVALPLELREELLRHLQKTKKGIYDSTRFTFFIYFHYVLSRQKIVYSLSALFFYKKKTCCITLYNNQLFSH